MVSCAKAQPAVLQGQTWQETRDALVKIKEATDKAKEATMAECKEKGQGNEKGKFT